MTFKCSHIYPTPVSLSASPQTPKITNTRTHAIHVFILVTTATIITTFHRCDELDEEVKELSRTSQGLKQKMEEKTKQCTEKNDRINELENELSAIRLVYKIRDVDFERVREEARSRVREGRVKLEAMVDESQPSTNENTS